MYEKPANNGDSELVSLPGLVKFGRLGAAIFGCVTLLLNAILFFVAVGLTPAGSGANIGAGIVFYGFVPATCGCLFGLVCVVPKLPIIAYLMAIMLSIVMSLLTWPVLVFVVFGIFSDLVGN